MSSQRPKLDQIFQHISSSGRIHHVPRADELLDTDAEGTTAGGMPGIGMHSDNVGSVVEGREGGGTATTVETATGSAREMVRGTASSALIILKTCHLCTHTTTKRPNERTWELYPTLPELVPLREGALAASVYERVVCPRCRHEITGCGRCAASKRSVSEGDACGMLAGCVVRWEVERPGLRRRRDGVWRW